MFSCTEGLFFLPFLLFNNNIVDVSLGLCSNSGRSCEVPFRPNHCCSSAMHTVPLLIPWSLLPLKLKSQDFAW